MCQCFNYIPRPTRTRFLHEMERQPRLGIYDTCFRLEAGLGRAAYHQLLSWADSLHECNDCRPKLRGR